VKKTRARVGAHKVLTRQLISQNTRTVATGSVVYGIDTAKNNGNFNLVLKDRGPRYCATTTLVSVNLLNSIEKIIARDKTAFSKSNRDIFIYEDKNIMYNLPLS